MSRVTYEKQNQGPDTLKSNPASNVPDAPVLPTGANATDSVSTPGPDSPAAVPVVGETTVHPATPAPVPILQGGTKPDGGLIIPNTKPDENPSRAYENKGLSFPASTYANSRYKVFPIHPPHAQWEIRADRYQYAVPADDGKPDDCGPVVCGHRSFGQFSDQDIDNALYANQRSWKASQRH